MGCTPRNEDRAFSEILQLIKMKDFFQARHLSKSMMGELDQQQSQILGALIANAFNNIELSDRYISELLNSGSTKVPDSILRLLLDIKQDNAFKKHRYREAKETLTQIVEVHGNSLSTEELDDHKNSLKLWTILQEQPPQEVVASGPLHLQMTKDMAGLDNLPITVDGDTIPFIFDTGANISTITRSTAERMGLLILQDSIEVGTITGSKVHARLGVGERMYLGGIEIRNAVFLVMANQALSFPQIGYQIHGILGFPVIAALGEIQIGKDGHFIVPDERASLVSEPNLALDHLSLIVNLDGRPYHLDTGADASMLYKRYYDEHREYVESNFEPTQINFGGAGGHQSYDGYHIDFPLTIDGKRLILEDIPLLMEKTSENSLDVYGNIGQDLLDRFETVIFDFNQMELRFH